MIDVSSSTTSAALTAEPAHPAECPAGYNVITGTPGPDWLIGTLWRDCIVGLGGDDILVGFGADDVLVGGPGDDLLFGGSSSDVLLGGPGDDALFGGYGDDDLRGGDGDDFLNGEEGADVVHGDDGNDLLVGGWGDRLFGGAGSDRINAPLFFVQVDGGEGTDACVGEGCELSGWAARFCARDTDCGQGLRCVLTPGVCVPQTQCAPSDATCDGHDDDCDGRVDDDFVPACVAGGVQSCVAGQIQVVSCDDANACSEDRCDAGRCLHATTSCDDGNACTTDSCDRQLGCTFRPTSNACNDGNACTSNDVCRPDGSCGGAAVSVDDHNPCTDDSCSPTGGVRHVAAVGRACDDGDACSVNDVCSASGACAPGPALDCNDHRFCTGVEQCDAQRGCLPGVPPVVDDGIACTEDSCDEETDRVVHVANAARCSDGLFCDGVELCSPVLGCVAGVAPRVDDGIACTEDRCDEATDDILHTPRAAACSDGLFCNGAEHCDAELGCIRGETPVVDDGIACTQDSCDEAHDAIVHTPRAEACSDGMFCNGAEQCSVTLGCVAGAAPAADDGIACTQDSCDEETKSIVHTPHAELCSDHRFCTGVEQCDATLGCVAGTPPVVDDGIACTEDSCDEETDRVEHTANNGQCSDGLYCNGAEQCDRTRGCVAGVAPVVDDGIACTDDSCDESHDTIVHTPRAELCSDHRFCTGVEQCDTQLGCVAGPALVLDDGIACTEDSCDEETDRIEHTPNAAACSDGLFCNGAEQCDRTRGCVAGMAPVVDDGVTCTVDRCDEATDLIVHQASDALCDDGNPCTGTERCDASSGCRAGTPLPVTDDHNVCTLDLCDPRTGTTVHPPNPCDDGSACTYDSCDVSLGCRHVANSLACKDGSACSVDDSCNNGTCFGGVARNCDDANDCTAEACSMQRDRCEYAQVADGIACRGGAGACLHGACVVGCSPSAHAPSVATIADFHVTVGVPVRVAVAAQDADGDTLRYELVGAALPAGLSLDAGSGEIRGTPTPAALAGLGATHHIVVAASDGCLRSSSNAFSIQVSGVPLPQPTAAFDFDDAHLSMRVLSSVYGGFSGVVVGSVRTGVPSRVGQRFEFGGTGSVRVGDQRSALKTSGSMTVALFLDGTTGGDQVYYSCGVPGEGARLSYAFQYGVQADGHLRAMHESDDLDNVSTSAQVAGTGPRALAYVRDASARTYRSYINGGEDSGGPVAYASNPSGFEDCIVTIGSDDQTESFARSPMDELAIWHQVLDANQVATAAWLYRKGISIERWVAATTSCEGILAVDPSSIDGSYVIRTGSTLSTVTCDMSDE